jgi:GTP-binding protein
MKYKIKDQSTKFIYGISNVEQLTEFVRTNTLPGVAFVGRSNVGKSSLINALYGNKVARVSNTPGRTREINVFEFTMISEDKQHTQQCILFDLPGYGHADVSKEMSKKWNELMNVFFINLPSNVLVVNIQDARHPAQESDQEFLGYLNNFSMTSIMALNKMDKLKTQKERAALQKILPQMSKMYKNMKQFYFVSAETKKGCDEFAQAILNFILNKTAPVVSADDLE